MKHKKSKYGKTTIWDFENGIKVYSKEWSWCGWAYDVCDANGHLLGSIYPRTREESAECEKRLDKGSEPITDKWDDGFGNICTSDGWGRAADVEKELSSPETTLRRKITYLLKQGHGTLEINQMCWLERSKRNKYGREVDELYAVFHSDINTFHKLYSVKGREVAEIFEEINEYTHDFCEKLAEQACKELKEKFERKELN